MKLTIATLGAAAAMLAGCVTDSPSHFHVVGMSRVERAAIVGADSSCDGASAREHRDPSSSCFISRGRSKD
jgi:hypothetical protein